MDNLDRIWLACALIAIFFMGLGIEKEQAKIQKDITEIKQTVERIELNTTVLDTIVVPLPDSIEWYYIEFKLIQKEVNNGNKY